MNVFTSLDKLTQPNVYSLLLFVLFKLSDLPETAPLSQLVYVLDKDNFIKLLKYFGGSTVTFPTIHELQVVIYCLTLYQSVNLGGSSLEEKMEEIPEVLREDVLSQYSQVVTIMEDYFV